MKIWLDDERPAPDESWVPMIKATGAMDLILAGIVTEISLDHDLGDCALTGYDVAKFIEKGAFYGKIAPIKWSVHSANPVGRQSIEVALRNADRYWAAG